MKKKIVFFYYKEHVVGGSLILFLKLAAKLAENNEYEVYYVNLPNKSLEEKYHSDNVTYYNANECEFSEFENAQFIVPLNYIFILLDKIKMIKEAKILLYVWQPFLIDYLFNQFYIKKRNDEQLLKFFSENNAVAFMDKSCQTSVNNWSNIKFKDNYIHVIKSEKELEFKPHKVISSDVINIGWMGRLDEDKIFSLINLADNLLQDNNQKKIDLHIIGDGNSKHRLELKKYSSKIRFIFTGFLLGVERDDYIKNNIDIMVAMGMSALDSSNLGIPTVLPIVSNHKFNDNKFMYLYDTIGYSLGWKVSELMEAGCKTNTIQSIIKTVYTDEGKQREGLRCYTFSTTNFSIESGAEKMNNALLNNKLSLKKCLDNQEIAKQLEFYDTYKQFRKNKCRNYLDFIQFIQKLNVLEKKSVVKKIYHIMKWGKKILVTDKMDEIRKNKNIYKNSKMAIQNYYDIQKGYGNKITKIREQVLESRVINVAFLVMYSSTFPTEAILEKLLEDKNFTIKIIVIPDMLREYSYRCEAYKSTLKDLVLKYGNRVVISGYNIELDLYYELEDRFNVVIFNNPYNEMSHMYHDIEYFKNKNVLTIYANYGFAAVKYGRSIMQTKFYNCLWKACVDSNMNLDDVKKFEPIKGTNAILTGYIKMDRLANFLEVPRKRKKIIISPHHTVTGWKPLDLSNFIKYAELFLKLPQKYEQIDFVFRPHPLLFYNLEKNNIWTSQQVKVYLDRMAQSPNITYDNSGDYMDLFVNSDAMIHDCSSFIGEYLFTEKPCCYMLKSEQQLDETFLPMGIECMKQYYKAYQEEDIFKFIDSVVINEIDPLKEQRQQFSREVLKFNYPNSADTIISEIKRVLLD